MGYIITMYTLNITSEFSAAHHIRSYEGRCARPHGHNYKISVEVQAPTLDYLGFVMDYYSVKNLLQETIEKLDHYDINTIEPFDKINPTAENIAAWFYKQLSSNLNINNSTNNNIHITAVILSETDDFSVRYTPD